MESCVLKNACTIKIENFEGPLDLLYHLIEKNKMSIYDIKLDEITDQYMEYLFKMQSMDLEIASEFLVMAATLLHIKSRLLLPNDKKANLNSDEEHIDPKEELLLKIINYKKFKEFSSVLEEREAYWTNCIYKEPESIEFVYEEEILDIEPFMLKDLFLGLLRRHKLKRNEYCKEDMSKIIQYEKVSLRSKIRDVIKSLINKSTVLFSEIFKRKEQTRLEIVTGFLAILELAKSKKIELFQKSLFSEIEIRRKDVEIGEEEIEKFEEIDKIQEIS